MTTCHFIPQGSETLLALTPQGNDAARIPTAKAGRVAAALGQSPRKVIYIAGPFRATLPNGHQDCWQIQRNVMAAMALSLEVWKLGHVALCPHANTMFFQNAAGTADDVWLDGDLELILRCDAVLFTSDWERSSGARAEREFATANHIPCFDTIEGLTTWLQ